MEAHGAICWLGTIFSQLGCTDSQRAAGPELTDREWHKTKKWYASGCANDPPQWSQYYERAKPTYTLTLQVTIGVMRQCLLELRQRRGSQDLISWSKSYGQSADGAPSPASAAAEHQPWQPRSTAKRHYKCCWRLFQRRCHNECPLDVQ